MSISKVTRHLRRSAVALVVAFASAFIVPGLFAQDRNIQVNEVYPADMFKIDGVTSNGNESRRIINVKALPAGLNGGVSAVGDGVADDSNAIIAAMDFVITQLKVYWGFGTMWGGGSIPWNEYWIIYFPDGIYRVTKPLVYPGPRVIDPIYPSDQSREGSCRLMLVGQSRDGTIIKLADNDNDFQSAPANGLKGKPVVSFSKADLNPAPINNNMPAQNQFRNFTIDTGMGNPFAIGLDFFGANVARIDNVRITGGGKIGLHLRMASAHGYYSNIIVEGFDHGIYLEGDPESHATIEYVTLLGQNISAIHQQGISSSFRKVQSENLVTGVHLLTGLAGKEPHMVIVDSSFTEGSGGASAFQVDSGILTSRNIEIQGYGATVKKAATTVHTGAIAEYVSEPMTAFGATRVNAGPVTSLNLPIEDYPFVPWISDFTQWANVDTYPGANDTQRIQNAMNSTKKVIYLPKNSYTITSTITIPATVEQVIGSHSLLLGSGTLFNISQSSTTPLVLHSLNLQNGQIAQNASRPVLLESSQSGDNLYDSNLGSTGTKVYVNNAHGFARYADTTTNLTAWIRWNNNEKPADWQFNADPGSTLVMFGFKSEKLYSVFQARPSSKLEVLGGLLNRPYTTGGLPARTGLFNDNAQVSFALATNGPSQIWTPFVKDSQGATTKTWEMTDFPDRNWSDNRVIPLYSSYSPTIVDVPAAPTSLLATAGSQQVTLAWHPSMTATSYNLYRSTTSNGQGLTPLVSGITGTTYTNTGLTNGTTYYYKVAAVNASGPSPQSNQAAAIPVAVPVKLTVASATASDSEGANPPAKAIDGSTSTRWSASVTSCPPAHWLTLDLGSVQTVNRVNTLFFNGLTYTYDISVSTDNVTFTTVVPSRNTTVPYAWETDTFAPVSARYVRINISSKNGTGPNTKPGILEAEIYH